MYRSKFMYKPEIKQNNGKILNISSIGSYTKSQLLHHPKGAEKRTRLEAEEANVKQKRQKQNKTISKSICTYFLLIVVSYIEY